MSVIVNKNMKTLDMPGKGDKEAMLDYIMGKEAHGQFPLGWCPTDRDAVRGALGGTGPGEIEDGKDNGVKGY